MKLALLGTLGGTHIGGSFARGAAKLGIEINLVRRRQGLGRSPAAALAVLAFGGPAAVASQPVLERACEGLRASQARDSRRDRHGAIDQIGAARVATIGHRQRELFDRRSLESGHAVELAPAGIAFV